MTVKAKIRFDFKANAGSRRFFWQRRDLRETAKTIRHQRLALLRNIPFQGLNVAELNEDFEIYLMPDDNNGREAAYAPAELVVEADSIEDLMPLTLKEEFRKIKLLEPEKLMISNNEMEKFLYKMNTEYRNEVGELEY